MKKFTKLSDFQEVVLSNQSVSRILGGYDKGTRLLTYGGYEDIMRDASH